jgi:hypothetical protein
MKTGKLFACFAAAALCVVAFLPTAGAGSALGHGVMIPAHPGQVLPRHNATSDSLNWSGYVDLPNGTHKVTNVTSTFVVPKVNGTTPGFAATWTGIGGYNSQDLIQAGVEEDYVTGLGATYGAWYEILPAAETPISNCSNDPNCTVRPGDKVTVTITAQSPIQTNQLWTVSIVDAGHWTYSIPITYQSTYSSAEYILEAPTVGAQTVMPMMGNTLFDPDTFAIDSGGAQTIASGAPVMVTMNQREGLPSALDPDGDGFNGCAYKLTCPAPLTS